MELEMEDDVFFADISKQIALLIMEEEEEEEEFEFGSALGLPVQCRQLHHQQELILPPMPPVRVPPTPPFGLEVPFPRESIASKGTGVFIPRSSNTPAKRKNKSRRSTVNPPSDANNTRKRVPLHKSNKNKMPYAS